MKIYISGAITNNPNAKEQFDKAKQTLLELNKKYYPISPMDLPHYHDQKWSSYMREDIKAMMDCQGIYLIEGWEKSKGARIEKELAESLDFKIIYELISDDE
jgi:hypothetical protein